ncbi:MAG: AAA family ATPase [Campylobacterota bacterium]|nr:AAA family ATPase [Campylobacterota bacterium]
MSIDKPLVKLSNISNKSIGKYFNVTEGAVRSWALNKPKTYEENLIEYKFNTQPFISIKEYSKKYNISIDKIKKKIKKEKIPSILSKYDKKIVDFIPFNSYKMLELKNEIKNLKSAKVITLANKKGGVGKTTTTVNLASTLSFLGYDVLVVDADTQANTTAMFDIYMNNGYEKTIVDAIYSVAKSKPEQAKNIVEDMIISVQDKLGFIGKLDILPNAGTNENEKMYENIETELKSFTNVNNVLDDVLSPISDKYDFILIDTPPRVDLTLRISAMASDYIIMVFTAEKMSKDGVPSFIGPLAEFNHAYARYKNKDINILGGIINAYAKNINLQKVFAEQIEEDLDSVLNRSDFNYSLNFIDGMSLNNSCLFQTKIRRSIKVQDVQLNGHGSFLSNNSLQEQIDESAADIIRDYFTLCDEIINRIFANLCNTNEL